MPPSSVKMWKSGPLVTQPGTGLELVAEFKEVEWVSPSVALEVREKCCDEGRARREANGIAALVSWGKGSEM